MNYLITLLIQFFVFIPIVTWSNNSTINNEVINTKVSIQKDTVFIVEKIPDEETIKYYQDILEKTNSQLNLWWNPYGILIGLLGVLFTILTIIAALVIFSQSREYKLLIRKSIKKHGDVLEQMILERNQQLKNIEANLNSTIDEYKEKLETATEVNKIEIKNLIQKLEKQRESIDKQIEASNVVPEPVNQSLASSVFGINRKYHRCSKCGYGYFVQADPYGLNRARFATYMYDKESITCPKCGNVELYNSFY